jgi:PUA domain protein
MKSSLQRQIRNKILEQYPYLSQPALPLPKALAPAVEDSDEELEDEDLGRRKKGAGKEKKSKKEAGGGGKGGKKGKKGQAAEEADEQTQANEDGSAGDEEVLTVMDTLWPKKEGCSLVKWYALSYALSRYPTS